MYCAKHLCINAAQTLHQASMLQLQCFCIVVSQYANTCVKRAKERNFWHKKRLYSVATRETQHICITCVQRRPNVFDVGPAFYKCHTKVAFLPGIGVLLSLFGRPSIVAWLAQWSLLPGCPGRADARLSQIRFGPANEIAKTSGTARGAGGQCRSDPHPPLSAITAPL